MMQERLSMSLREIKRLDVIQKVKRGDIRQVDASPLLGITVRQIQRLLKKYREHGAKGLIHGLRGKIPGF